MKQSIYILLTASMMAFVGKAQSPNYQINYVATTTATPFNCIEIPSAFAKGNVYDKNVLSALKDKKVVSVELWYTRFKQNPLFDQVKLNRTRIDQLKTAYPELNSADIKWIWKEQTEADTKEEASRCFHGFRIFTSDEKPIWTNEFRIDDPANRFEKITVDAAKGTTYTAKSGSVVHIPPMAVSDENGNPIIGNYTIEYAEYRNSAQIAYSGLPMKIDDAGQEYAFNSAGMYEIQGYQNNKPLQLTKSITVDFNCTDQLDELNFYALDPQTGTWLKRKPLDFEKQNATKSLVKQEEPAVNNREVFIEFDGTRQVQSEIVGDLCNSTLYKQAWNSYLNLKKTEPEYVKKIVLNEIPEQNLVQVKDENSAEFLNKLFVDQWMLHDDLTNSIMKPIKSVQQNATLLASGADQGHTYPNLVKGLNSPKFGVYNCDQQYRMGRTISLIPTYVDQQSGTSIPNTFVMCVINKDVNGSFSFSPSWITISASSETDLVLFTKDN